MKTELKIDWATYEAAKYAVEHWHYSKTMVMPQSVKLGVWENNTFVGVVIFNRGACNDLGKAYGLKNTETCELVRVALKEHKSQVSRILSICMKFLKNKCPKLKLIVSFADPHEGHHGGIYQAGNWIYTGRSASSILYHYKGKRQHPRNLSENGYIMQFGKKKPCVKPSQCVKEKVAGKFRYLMPLDNEMKKRILPLSKPYPKRAESIAVDAPCIQQGEGSASLTSALQSDDA